MNISRYIVFELNSSLGLYPKEETNKQTKTAAATTNYVRRRHDRHEIITEIG